MLRTIYFDNQLCGSAVKIHDESADDPLFVNLYWVFAKKKIPELTFMGSHFPAKPPGIFQLAVIFRYGHIFTLSVLAALGHLSQRERQVSLSRLRRQLSQGESQVPHPTHYTERCIEVRPFVSSVNYNLL